MAIFDVSAGVRCFAEARRSPARVEWSTRAIASEGGQSVVSAFLLTRFENSASISPERSFFERELRREANSASE